LKQSLKDALPLAEAFVRLLHPFAEVVVHDLKEDRIEAIFNPLSRRVVGDNSHLERMNFDDSTTIFGPYDKTNWDGRPMKSISVVIRNGKGNAEGFLCINVDTSAFETANSMIQSFLKNTVSLPEGSERIFKDDLYEKINLYANNYCRNHKLSISALSRHEKRKLIHALLGVGAFKERNAATYVGRVLGISRATVYNYLKEQETV